MANQPLISVIVPCYNQAQYMDECLQSVLDQTYTNWECIIVNDGSPDNTEQVAQKWIQKDSRFKYLKKENGGLSSARNAGIEIAKGEWILPLDADDKIGNRYLELAQLEFNKGYTIIYCEADFFGDKIGKWNLPKYNIDEMVIHNLIFCSGFFKKVYWIEVGGYDENLLKGYEDWEFWISILKNKNFVCRLNYVGFYYRIKNKSMVKSFHNDKMNKEFTLRYIYKKHSDFFINKLPPFQDVYENNLKMLNEIEYYKLRLNSKRVKFINKILAIFSK